MKIQFLSLFLAAVLLLPFATVAAQKAPADDAVGDSNGQQDIAQGQAVPMEAQTQTQTQTQDQGEGTMIMTQNMEAAQTNGQNQGGNGEMDAGMQQDASQGQKGVHEPGTGSGDSAQTGNGQTIGVGQQAQVKSMGENRRSQVANAVQVMLQVADRSGEIGEQIRVIAQKQNQNQQEMEAGLEKVQTRSKVMKFLFGPGYKQVRVVEKKMEEHSAEVEKLKQAKEQLSDVADQAVIAEQIAIMEQAREELQAELSGQEKVFSLFGWLAKMFVK